MSSLHPDIERAWWRMTLMLVLLAVLFALLKDVSWRSPATAPESPAEVAEAAPVPAAPLPASPIESPAATKRLLFPLAGHEGALRDNFAEKRGVRTHKALDIMAPRGTPVRAVDDGVVAKLYHGPLAGIAVYQFDRETKHVYFYAHLDRLATGLKEGLQVSRGEVIGYVGSTGNAPESAPHLHFEMRELGTDKRWWRGEAINPYELLRAAEG